MISKIHSISVNGLDSTVVDCEVDINMGMVAFTIVGLPDQGIQESKERIRSALKASRAKLPPSRITVNLAPANIRKSGPSFDLPIAIGILHNQEYFHNTEVVEKSIFIGELALDGTLRKVASILPATIGARDAGFTNIFLPKANVKEASIIPGINVYGVEKLENLVDFLNGDKEMTPEEPFDFFAPRGDEKKLANKYDFRYVVGQEHAKRALEIAATGGHNIIMSGPPGSGKTMLAKAFASILPKLTLEESIEISKIYSINGLLSEKEPIVRKRPFRTVHHTASGVSIIGGGRNANPGEISLAHKGVLFLDEILEFPKQVLEVLRQPLEDGNITVTRVNASYEYPAKFTLVGAMNPCPCGYVSDPEKECHCSTNQVKSYRSRLSGPLIDRVDIFIEVPRVKTEKFKVDSDYSDRESSEQIALRVQKARDIQEHRFQNLPIHSNAEMSTKEMNEFCQLGDEENRILKQAVASMNLSARAYYRVIKLARTIADLGGEEIISSGHILEALSFRKGEE